MSEFVTEVSEVTNGVVNLRGYSLADVMRDLTYTEGAHLSITGRLPTDAERRLLDGVLNSLLDHGFVASTITAARYIASGNPQFVTAVAGGLLAAGSNTLSPQHAYEMLGQAARLRDEKRLDHDAAAQVLVTQARSQGRRIPGLGHPTHKASDFRAEVLFELAAETGLAGNAILQMRAIHREVARQTGRSTLPVNVDGALAAVGLDVGWSAEQTVAFALLSVLPGLMAHVAEEIHDGKPLRYIRDGSYRGPALRPLPKKRTEN